MADCWVATGQESSLKKWKKATHGAVYASKIITWDQKTRAKSTQRFSSEEAQNASDQSAMWKCDLSSIKRKESMSMWRMLATCVTAASLAEAALEVKAGLTFSSRRGWRHYYTRSTRLAPREACGEASDKATMENLTCSQSSRGSASKKQHSPTDSATNAG